MNSSCNTSKRFERGRSQRSADHLSLAFTDIPSVQYGRRNKKAIPDLNIKTKDKLEGHGENLEP